jgi:hypothetical protein
MTLVKTDVPEVVKQLCPGVRILDDVEELVLVVLQDPGAPVVVPTQQKHDYTGLVPYCMPIFSFK